MFVRLVLFSYVYLNILTCIALARCYLKDKTPKRPRLGVVLVIASPVVYSLGLIELAKD